MPQAPKASADSGKSATPPKARKKTTKRGPTRAAALKALGLTAEELRDLKAAAKELAALQADTGPEPADEERDYGAQRHAEGRTITGEAVVTPANREDPQRYLEDRPGPEKAAWNAPDTDAEPVWYIRNLRGVDVGFRLTRQQKQGEKRTNLKPRGARGDMVRLEPNDLRDPELSMQVGYGLVEVIPEGEALEAINKQFTNQQTQVPNHIALLRNPKGEEYAQADPVKFATDEEAYGIKVADLNPALMQGKLSDKEIARDGGLSQGLPTNVAPGGNPAIISDGFMAAEQSDAGLGSTDPHAQEIDALARSKQFEGPGAGLGEVTVKVMPTRRVQ